MRYLVVSKKRIHKLCQYGIEKIHPSSLVTPISDPWDGLFYPTFTHMLRSYYPILTPLMYSFPCSPVTLHFYIKKMAPRCSPISCRDFLAILGRGPRAFQIGKISVVNPTKVKMAFQKITFINNDHQTLHLNRVTHIKPKDFAKRARFKCSLFKLRFTHKGPPIICSRRQFQILLLSQK